MKVIFLTFFVFLSCGLAMSSSNFHKNLTSKTRGSDPSLGNVQTQELVESNRSIKDSIPLDRKVEERKSEGKYEVFDNSGKAQRGMGTSGPGGGSNINHRQPSYRNYASPVILSRHDFWFSIFPPCVSLTLILAFPFLEV